MKKSIKVSSVSMCGDLPIATVTDETGAEVARLTPFNFGKGIMDRNYAYDIGAEAAGVLSRFGVSMGSQFERTNEFDQFVHSVIDAVSVD